MARTRAELHEVLCELIGNRNVYFQPPSTVQMKYPCLVYSLNDVDARHADDVKYLTMKRYSVVAISKNPDQDIYGKLLELPYTSFDRSYVADNLNHWVITLYY